MYKIPVDLEIIKFKNERINQITFGLNVIILFIGKNFIQFSGSFLLQVKGETFYHKEVCPVKNDFGLLQLLELKITNIYTNDERDILLLDIEGDIVLKLLSNEMYESFEINIDGRRIIV